VTRVCHSRTLLIAWATTAAATTLHNRMIAAVFRTHQAQRAFLLLRRDAHNARAFSASLT
jgi:hypothetical protein